MVASNIPVVTQVRSRTLGDRVADSIVSAAIHGHIKAGDRLVELDLAETFSVSRVPVREALKTLESEGIVVALPNREVRLVTFTRHMLEELLSVRLVLENHAIDLAMNAIAKDPALLVPFEDALHDMAGAIRKHSAFLAAQADMEFHRAIYQASGNSILLEMWDRIARKILVAVGLSLYQAPDNAVLDDHRALLDVLISGDIKSFKKVLKPHIMEACERFGAFQKHG
jgi:DNA-binding GntR family transcriptional regulator